ncbi:MAG: DUF134 domain-containing protein [Thaumarchaeota archaeon]|jgi:predicted DNA-binding protein (UPF0251 family)|nr:DUF134 domain-containing protein [Candidatus Geocrenenecus arthurdayi]MCL7389456.1 DUF134 domain-containing protein [Candidatus Geocrenenecus arthurdayi]MCL7391059.1 DUF134 domain-containing protein [Candidatus Geocrenenecus arthurdayi]MCL7396573.1 DUF134 domain-containing protein [Candidatus Geocrenenecus arthurdayi]MCL7403435.1 DUF134 domain-containing protein [Candidatus Geocrenenecus arthurdayi]
MHRCWCRRHRCGRVGRLPKPVSISLEKSVERLDPSPKHMDEPIYLDVAEVEALRLIELEKLTFEKAGERMNVSRNTVWRLVESGREKLVRAMIEGRPIIILKE